MSELNRNIEVIIPGKLAAVKFSYIPFIPEIEYTPPDKDIPAYTEACRITDDGVFLLNKDLPGYELLKGIVRKVIRIPLHRLNRERAKLANKKAKTPYEDLYGLCLEAELERREKAKRGVR